MSTTGPWGGDPTEGAETVGDSTGDGSSGLSQLATLSAGAIGTLVTVATNPREWVYGLIAEWLVTQIIDVVQYVLGWVVFGFERTSSIIQGVAGPLASPFGILEDAIVGAIETMYGLALGVAHSVGFAGPPAAAFAVALNSAVLAAVVYALWRAFPATEALGGSLEAIR